MAQYTPLHDAAVSGANLDPASQSAVPHVLLINRGKQEG
jgi:hypothetical protein